MSVYKIEIPELIGPFGVFEVWVRRAIRPYFDLHRVIKNLITSAGKAALSNIAIGAGTAPTHIAIGTGTTAAAAGDTTLQTEIYRGAATRSRVTTTVTNDTAQHILEQAIGATHAVTEAGLLNASSGGDLYSRQVFAAVNVYSGDVFRVVWKLIN